MNVLMIDVGGSSVKMMASGHEGFRKFPAEKNLTAARMVKGVKEATKDWKYEAVSLGFPGIVMDGKPARNPLNLGANWVGFDYAKALKRPVRIINDASLQALANYDSGRMLFIGLGTSIGATLIADDVIVPVEVGMMRLKKSLTFVDCLSKQALNTAGPKRWEKSVWQAVELLRDLFWPDHVVIGGGNAGKLKSFPAGCAQNDNQGAFRGALRLWPGADMLAEAQATTWRITRTKARKK